MYTAPIPQPSAPQGQANSALIARQAIVNAEGQIIGHELFNRSRNHSAHTAASDMMLALTALSHAGEDELLGDSLIFVNCTHESLIEGHLALLNPGKVILEIPALGHTAAAEVKTRLPILQSLQARGFRLAFSHTVLESAYSAWLPLADFIKLDLSVLPADQVTVLVKYATRVSRAQLIAEKIETAAQLELLTHLGVTLFQGYWLSRPQVLEARLKFPAKASVGHLAQMLRNDANAQDLAQWVKRDTILTFNLLRLLVTSGVAPAKGVASLEHAVSLLGHDRLACWVGLIQTFRLCGDDDSAPARTAMLFGRFMELLAKAQQLPQEVSDQAYLVGMISQLGDVLNLPLSTITGLLNTPKIVSDAVLQQSGYLGALLGLAQSSELGGDDEWISAANALRLSPKQLLEAHNQAKEWAYSR